MRSAVLEFSACVESKFEGEWEKEQDSPLLRFFLFLNSERDLKRFNQLTKLGAMSATIISEPVIVASQETPSTSSPSSTTMTASTAQIEIESANCDCCGLTEECTPEYIERIRERYAGKWICGLCAEVVKDEIFRSDRLISTEEALACHLNVCRKFRCSWPPETDPTVHLISAVRQILLRSLESPRGVRSTPGSPIEGGVRHEKMLKGIALARSESC